MKQLELDLDAHPEAPLDNSFLFPEAEAQLELDLEVYDEQDVR